MKQLSEAVSVETFGGARGGRPLELRTMKPQSASGRTRTIRGERARSRAVWGTNGLPWKESLDQVDGLGLRDEARRKLIRDNARELFKI